MLEQIHFCYFERENDSNCLIIYSEICIEKEIWKCKKVSDQGFVPTTNLPPFCYDTIPCPFGVPPFAIHKFLIFPLNELRHGLLRYKWITGKISTWVLIAEWTVELLILILRVTTPSCFNWDISTR